MKARGATTAVAFALLHLLLSATQVAANTTGPDSISVDVTSTSTPAANTAGAGVFDEAVKAPPTLIPRQNKPKVALATPAFQRCSPDCAGCNLGSQKVHANARDLRSYSKAPNGALYLPEPTATAPTEDDQAAKAKRAALKETYNTGNGLTKRVLSNPNDSFWFGRGVSSWLLNQISLPGHRLLHGYGAITTTGFTFWLGRFVERWTLVDLYGCTSVIVISRKRIFMTHIWEDPTMMNPPQFQTDVLDRIRHGGPGVRYGLTAFTGPGGDFENTPENKVRAFIITPYRRDVPNPAYDDYEFPDEVKKIRALLKSILDRDDALPIPYTASGPDPTLSRPNGKVLIQYDPQARTDCNPPVAGVELWFEDLPRPRYTDRWSAFPGQRVPGHKRSNADEPGGMESNELGAEDRKKEDSSCPRPNPEHKPSQKPSGTQTSFATITKVATKEMSSSTSPTSTASFWIWRTDNPLAGPWG